MPFVLRQQATFKISYSEFLKALKLVGKAQCKILQIRNHKG